MPRSCSHHIGVFVLFRSLQFAEAFHLMKKHRINMNLMYDHNPVVFLDNTDTFVRQLDRPSYINLFLTDLRFNRTVATLFIHSPIGALELMTRRQISQAS